MVGFEPTSGCRPSVLQTDAMNLSATSSRASSAGIEPAISTLREWRPLRRPTRTSTKQSPRQDSNLRHTTRFLSPRPDVIMYAGAGDS